MTHARTIAAAALLLATQSGCLLAEPADTYPFAPVLAFDPTDVGNDSGLEADVPPPKPPLLVFTEVLLDAPSIDLIVTERGEYIEIKNIGEGPADPRQITMILSDVDGGAPPARIEVVPGFTADEKAAVAALKPIMPNQYFVFIRYEVPEVAPISDHVLPGAIYDFGRYASGPTLPHQTAASRRLELGYRYKNGDTETFDTIRWEGHDFIAPEGDGEAVLYGEGQALGVDSSAEDPVLNDDPKKWCVPPNLVGAVNGTPGEASSCP